MLTNKEINWKIIASTRRYMVESVALFLGVVFILIFAIIPQFQAFFSIREKINDEKPVVEKLEAKLANLDSVEISPQFAQAEIVNQALPSKKPLLELLTSLQSSAQKANIAIVNFEVSPGELASSSGKSKNGKPLSTDYDFLELDVEIQGTFADVQTFFDQVEKFVPFTSISSINVETPALTQDQVKNSEELITASLTTRTYYFTKSIQSTVESPLPNLKDKDIAILEQLRSFVAVTVPEQQDVTGGGNEDIFGGVRDFFNE